MDEDGFEAWLIKSTTTSNVPLHIEGETVQRVVELLTKRKRDDPPTSEVEVAAS